MTAKSERKPQSFIQSQKKEEVEKYLWEMYREYTPGATLEDYRAHADWIISTYVIEMHGRHTMNILDAVGYQKQPAKFPKDPNDN